MCLRIQTRRLYHHNPVDVVRISKRCAVAQFRVSPGNGLQFTLVLSTQDTRIACGGGLPTHFFVAPGQYERS